MPSFTSNFKRKLRLPRLFFAKPSEIAPRDYERPIPALPWRGMTVTVVLVVIAAAATFSAVSLGAPRTTKPTNKVTVLVLIDDKGVKISTFVDSKRQRRSLDASSAQSEAGIDCDYW